MSSWTGSISTSDANPWNRSTNMSAEATLAVLIRQAKFKPSIRLGCHLNGHALRFLSLMHEHQHFSAALDGKPHNRLYENDRYGILVQIGGLFAEARLDVVLVIDVRPRWRGALVLLRLGSHGRISRSGVEGEQPRMREPEGFSP